jgi:hypothetical protein
VLQLGGGRQCFAQERSAFVARCVANHSATIDYIAEPREPDDIPASHPGVNIPVFPQASIACASKIIAKLRKRYSALFDSQLEPDAKVQRNPPDNELQSSHAFCVELSKDWNVAEVH